MKAKWIGLLLTLVFSRIGWTADFTYILCEGNFNSTNASLWQLTGTNQLTGPLHWNFTTNPLGDVGQNLKIYQDRLFIVMNNSNSLEVMKLSASGATYERSLALPYAGPRDIAFVADHAYITCWYLPGILALDLTTWQIDDTIAVNGLPDNIIAAEGRLYTSIAMNTDWSAADKVIVLDSTGGEYFPVETFIVLPGPNQILLHGQKLYVLSTYYDASWNTYTGTSCIDLIDRKISIRDLGRTTNYCDDLALINGRIYRTYNGCVAPLTDSLTINASKAIGNYSGIYSMAFNGRYLFIGLSDYNAPDQVVILDTLGNRINTLTVGVCPGAYAFYTAPSSITEAKVSRAPANFQLLPNYPNPFNSSTVIPFILRNGAQVQLTVYNQKGEQVTELVNGFLPAGRYDVVWDGRRLRGQAVATGIYWVRLVVGNESLVAKVLFVK